MVSEFDIMRKVGVFLKFLCEVLLHALVRYQLSCVENALLLYLSSKSVTSPPAFHPPPTPPVRYLRDPCTHLRKARAMRSTGTNLVNWFTNVSQRSTGLPMLEQLANNIDSTPLQLESLLHKRSLSSR